MALSYFVPQRREAHMRWAMISVLSLLATPSLAAIQADIGVLTCTLAEHGEKDTNPDSQSRLMHCAFKPTGAGPEETYVGEIKKVGSQTELTGTRVLIWAVLGPSNIKLKPAVLAQSYLVDASAEGRQSEKPNSPESLVGDRDKSLSLRAITDEAHEPNDSRTVTLVELRIKSSPG
jgi:hypothetical protein